MEHTASQWCPQLLQVKPSGSYAYHSMQPIAQRDHALDLQAIHR
jgi:hypothetical protein